MVCTVPEDDEGINDQPTAELHHMYVVGLFHQSQEGKNNVEFWKFRC